MANIGTVIKDIQPGGIPLVELLGAGAAKPVLEGMLKPYIGNSNIISGAVKLGGALALPSVLGKNTLSNIGSLALGIDGAEDLMMATVGKLLPALGGGGQASSGTGFSSIAAGAI